MSEPRAVVIGYGFAGKSFHSYLISLNTGLKLHGIASRNPETRQRIEAERGCKAYSSFDEVIADLDVDLVVLATPNSTHRQLAVKALEAGKNVVTDKIMCVNVEECDQMIAAAKKSGKLLTVFQNRRWDGDFFTVWKLIHDGALGDVRWVEMAWQGFGPMGGWRGKAAMGGGRFFDLGAHLVDQMCLLIPDRIVKVYCRMQHEYENSDTASHVMVMIHFEDGTTGIIDTSGLNAIQKPRFYVCGTRGTFCKYGLDPQERAMLEERIDEAVEDKQNYGLLSNGKEVKTVPTERGRWRNYYENIAEVLTKGAEPLVKLHEVRRCIQVFDAARKSAETGQAVEVDIPALC